MANLKPYLDAARAADAKVQSLIDEMDTHFQDGTEEGKQKALDLRPALDEAKSQAEKANALYVSMRDASLVKDNSAALFVPPADPADKTSQAEAGPKVMKRPEFDALTPPAKMEYIKAGGSVTDE